MQIACYELRRQAIGERDGSATPVSRSEVEAAVARIAEHLRDIGFFKVTRDRDLAAFLRDSAERAAFTAKELRYFESIFRKAAGMLRGRLEPPAADRGTRTRCASPGSAPAVPPRRGRDGRYCAAGGCCPASRSRGAFPSPRARRSDAAARCAQGEMGGQLGDVLASRRAAAASR